MKRNLLFCFILFSVASSALAQGSFFGGLELNSDFYVRDTSIGAAATPHYDNLKSSTNSWFNLNYVNNDYQLDVGLRLDLYNNSNLHNPGIPYSARGVGLFFARKKIDDFRITGGHFYDQIGSGIIFRTYEDRTLGIDNALFGIRLEYEATKNIQLKAFTGVQKNRLQFYEPIVSGFNGDGNFAVGEKVQLLPGLGIVNRTIDQSTMDLVVSTIESYDVEERFVPRYNAYAFSAYNTLNVGSFSWYVEGAYKTEEAIPAPDGVKLRNADGNVIYSTLTYSRRGFGITALVKRTEDFFFRIDPTRQLLEGMLSFIPPVSQQNARRLPGRYVAATQELEEIAYGADITFSPIKQASMRLNYSDVRAFNGTQLYREAFGEAELKPGGKWKADVGIQYIEYDQDFYEKEVYGSYRLVRAITPFVEVIYKLSRKHSIRIELQDQFTEQDFGSWAYGLIEYNIAPWFSLAASDMYNYDPNPGRVTKANHYYSLFTAVTLKGSNRLSLAYARQVEGVICTGGICRFEPAFNGVRFSLTSTF